MAHRLSDSVYRAAETFGRHELTGLESGVTAARDHELMVRTLLDNTTFVQHKNTMRGPDRR